MADYQKLLEENRNIFIISKASCPSCVMLKQLFDTIAVEYTVYMYKEEDTFSEEMKEHTKATKFPFCYINGKYAGNYSNIEHALITGNLKTKLKEIGIEYEIDF